MQDSFAVNQAGRHSRQATGHGGSEFAGGAGPTAARNAARRSIPPKLYRIGEVAEHYGCSRQTIHNYTTMGLIREAGWTRGGHRQYDETVFERINLIQDLKAARTPMVKIREKLETMDT